MGVAARCRRRAEETEGTEGQTEEAGAFQEHFVMFSPITFSTNLAQCAFNPLEVASSTTEESNSLGARFKRWWRKLLS